MTAKFQLSSKSDGYQWRAHGADRIIVPLVFDSEEAGNAWIKENLPRYDQKHWEIIPYVGDPNWRDREDARFQAGKYMQPPWESESWYKIGEEKEPMCYHWLHISVNDVTKVAFTENEKKGMFDRQTAMLPGRYLQKFYGNVLTPAQIAEWSAKFGAYFAEPTLQFATTSDDIERVYVNGPRSCMSGGKHDYLENIHPVRAYGAGDLAVAYIERTGKITARTVCWPEKKVFTRIYGDAARLVPLLRKEGYHSNYSPNDDGSQYNLYGARMLAIKYASHTGYAAPYLDDGYWKLSDNGKFLIITGDSSEAYNNDDEEPEYRYICDRCEEGCHDGFTVYARSTATEQFWCESCTDDNATRCVYCDNYRESDYVTWINISRHRDRPFCDDCIERGNVEYAEIDGTLYTLSAIEEDKELSAKYAEMQEEEAA